MRPSLLGKSINQSTNIVWAITLYRYGNGVLGLVIKKKLQSFVLALYALLVLFGKQDSKE